MVSANQLRLTPLEMMSLALFFIFTGKNDDFFTFSFFMEKMSNQFFISKNLKYVFIFIFQFIFI
jgi:hypothetical protein